jgi:hypothetical protein
MRRLCSLLFLVTAVAAAAGPVFFNVPAGEPGSWPQILSSIGLAPAPATSARLFVLRAGAQGSTEWLRRVESGSFLVLEGNSPVAEAFGFRPTNEFERVGSVEDVHRPKLAIIWEKPLELPRFEVPAGAQVFAKDRWSGAPLIAGMRSGSGAVLWMATSPGERGYERYPYILHALVDLGLEVPYRSSRLWAFFDDSYRTRVDVEYFAERWQASGIAALHVSAWHFFEPSERDEYLRNLISACHRRGILVYAWLELPHVSEKFWEDHPDWREKTALLQDAHLDWRKLMNLANRDCFEATKKGVEVLLNRFDWDGANLAELYFESLEGTGNASRFTPMNGDVRRLFSASAGFDPIEIFRGRPDEGKRRAFLDFRADLARRMQQEWLGAIEAMRKFKPHLDVVLTHVDDRLDAGMKDAIGADAGRVLPMIERREFTFLVEDPATVWNLGPERYPEIARRYAALITQTDRLAIDINIVERYQNVYPTKQQTGTELFQLVHLAAASFPRVALYFENSILPPDWKMLSSAAAVVTRIEQTRNGVMLDSPSGIGVPWQGPAVVDGAPWPITDGATLWLSPGSHQVEPGLQPLAHRVLRFEGNLKSAAVIANGIGLSYQSSSRTFAIVDRVPSRVVIDGAVTEPVLAGPTTLILPRGQHLISLLWN